MSRSPFSDNPRTAAEQEAPALRRSVPSSTKRHLQSETEPQGSIDRDRIERGSQKERTPEALDKPRAYYLRDRAYFLRSSELQTLLEVGTFRAIAASDLARISYGGDTQRMEREIRRLRDQSLLSEKVVRAGRHRTTRLLALTRTGARLARNSSALPQGQILHQGFVKPREAKHDADLYRLYHAEAERIKKAGGRPVRVVLDFELKRNLNRDLAGLPPEQESDKARERIAERHGLAFVNGKIPVPDLRIEYDTADLERQHVDLELATRNYRPRALADKAKAGFSLYAARQDAQRLRRVLDQREITPEILAL